MAITNKRDNEHEALREAQILVKECGGNLENRTRQILEVFENTNKTPTERTLMIGRKQMAEALADPDHSWEVASGLS